MLRSAYTQRLERLRRILKESSGAAAFSLDEGRYPRSSGGELAYVYLEVKDSKHLTILFHGTGNDLLFTWQGLIKALIHRGRSVLLFDLDGHGQGSDTTLTRAHFESMTLDLQKFLRERKLDTHPYELVGYSLGALSILHAYSSQSLKPEKIVLIALPLRIRITVNFLWNELRSLFSPEFYRQWKTYGWRETIPAFGSFRRRSFPLRLEQAYEGHYPSLVDALLQDHPPLDEAAKLSQNCLLVFGAHDKLAPYEDLWRQAAPSAQILVIDRANHFLLPFHSRTIEAISAWIG